MHIKPECDVENVEDFARYYKGAYMESREGPILQVIGHHSTSLVLKDHASITDDNDGHVLLKWNHIQRALVYGRPPSGFLKHDKRVYFIQTPDNRMAGRGFSAGYYTWKRVRDWAPVDWKRLGKEYELAKAAFNPVYVTLDTALKQARERDEESLLDVQHALCIRDGVSRLFRRDTEVGRFNEDHSAFKMEPHTPYIQSYLHGVLQFQGAITK